MWRGAIYKSRGVKSMLPAANEVDSHFFSPSLNETKPLDLFDRFIESD